MSEDDDLSMATTTNPEVLKKALDVALEALCWIAHYGRGSDIGRAAVAYNEAKALINRETSDDQPTEPS